MRFVFVLMLCCFPVLLVMADGKMYSNPRLSPGIPYQQAVILHEQGMQTLIVQSQWRLSIEVLEQLEEPPRLGWIVPVPAIPEVGAIDGTHVHHLFWQLNRMGRPLTIHLGPYVFIVLAVITLLVLLISVVSILPGCQRVATIIPATPSRILLYCLLTLLAMGMLFPGITSARDHGIPIRAVNVVGQHQVGHYDVQVISATDRDALFAWFDQHELSYSEADESVFAGLIEAGWYFCVVNLSDPEVWTWENRLALSSGVPDALVLRFPADEAVYPLALTGSAGHDTEVRLHILSPGPVADDGRLHRTFAGPLALGRAQRLFSSIGTIEPEDFFGQGHALHAMYLTTLHGTLTPEQMASDLVLRDDPHGRDIRQRIWRW